MRGILFQKNLIVHKKNTLYSSQNIYITENASLKMFGFIFYSRAIEHLFN